MFEALSYTDKDSSLQNELHKIQQSAIKAGLPEDKVSKIISSRKVAFNCDKSNCDNVSNVSESDNTDSKRFVLLHFINAKLANEAKSFFYNNDVKVSFSTGRNLYSLVRPRESTIEGKYLQANVVYQYKCNSCDRNYIGYTARPLNVRAFEHVSKSSCLSRAHRSFECTEVISKDSFFVACKGSSVFDLKVKEAFFLFHLLSQV